MKKKGIVLPEWVYNLILVIIGLIFFEFLPLLSLNIRDMVVKKTDHFAFHYLLKDQKGMDMTSAVLETNYTRINTVFGISNNDRTEVYLYTSPYDMHRKKMGNIAAFFLPAWYIGDNVSNIILIVTPENPGSVHNSNSVLLSAVNEYVHTLIWKLNPKTPKWITDGLAGYMSGQKPDTGMIRKFPIPDLKQMHKEDSIRFGNADQFPYTWIEFLVQLKGLPAVLELVKGSAGYEKIFDKSEAGLYQDWLAFLKKNY